MEQKVTRMSPSEWIQIFEPSVLSDGTYRRLKSAVVQQEMAIFGGER